jgi:hypothetical protein
MLGLALPPLFLRGYSLFFSCELPRNYSLSCVFWYCGGACFPSPRSAGELVGDLRPSLKPFMTPTVFSGSVTENLHVNQGIARCYPGAGAEPWAQEDSTCADPTFLLLMAFLKHLRSPAILFLIFFSPDLLSLVFQ